MKSYYSKWLKIIYKKYFFKFKNYQYQVQNILLQTKNISSKSQIEFQMEKIKQIIQKLDGVDPYDVLESKVSDDFNSLKKNYRALALKYHPDRNKQQTAKQTFIKINLAYEFLQLEENRQIYQNNLKALEQQKLRQQKMTDDRKRMLDELRRREQEFNQRKKYMNQELKRKKQFFQKKMKQEEERENLKSEILSQMKPHQYYQDLSSIKVQWAKGLSFSKFLLQKAFSQYGKISNIKIEPRIRQGIVTFSSIENCAQVIKKMNNPLIKIDFLVQKQRRQHLLKALKKQNNTRQIDFSLTTQNLTRLKEVLNRNSSLYIDPSRMSEQ